MLFFGFFSATAQFSAVNDWLKKSDTLNQKRFYASLGISSTCYLGFSTGLYHAWYKNHDLGKFHLYNDLGEWRHVDKVGHFYTAYLQGVLCYEGAKWVGLSDNKAMLTGFVMGSLFQSTIEVMDGFSNKWGFSIPDMVMNVAGSSAAVIQQYYWKEQRIRFKVSNVPRSYPNDLIYSTNGQTSMYLQERANQLYGNNFAQRFLKDYNSQVTWASFNLEQWTGERNIFPKYLSIAIGYGAGNMFGGYKNEWTVNQAQFVLDTEKYPRYSSFFIAPDIDLKAFQSEYRLVNTLLEMLNIFKIPLPALEYNTLGEFHVHWFM